MQCDGSGAGAVRECGAFSAGLPKGFRSTAALAVAAVLAVGCSKQRAQELASPASRPRAPLLTNSFDLAAGAADEGSVDIAQAAVTPSSQERAIASWSLATNVYSGVRVAHCAARAGDYIYVAGGIDFTNSVYGATLADVQVSRISSTGEPGPWVSAGTMLRSRTNHACVAYNGFFYATGGDQGDMVATEFAAIHPDGTLDTFHDTSAFPLLRTNHDITAINGRILVIGGTGLAGSFADALGAAVNPDGTLGQWTSVGSVPNPGQWAGYAVAGNYLYQVGGQSAGGQRQTLVTVAPVNADGSIGPDRPVTPLEYARAIAKLAVANGRLYVASSLSDGYPSGDDPTVISAPILADGTLGAWVAEGIVPQQLMAGQARTVPWNANVIVLGTTRANATANYIAIGHAGPGTPRPALSWRTGTPLPVANGELSVATKNGHLYAIDGDYSQRVWRSDPDPLTGLGAWNQETSIAAPARGDFGAAVAGNQIIIEGGNTAGVITDDVQTATIGVNGALSAWSVIAQLPYSRRYHRAVATSQAMYLVGGYGGTGGAGTAGNLLLTTSVAPLDGSGSPGAWSATMALPTGSAMQCVLTDGARVYVAGGTTDWNAMLAEAWSAPVGPGIALGSWRSERALPTPRGHVGCALVNGAIVFVGGYVTGNSNAVLSDTLSAQIQPDGSLGPWTLIGNLPAGRSNVALAQVGRHTFVVGGSVAPSPGAPPNSSADVQIGTYDDRSAAYSRLLTLPAATLSASALRLRGAAGASSVHVTWRPGSPGAWLGPAVDAGVVAFGQDVPLGVAATRIWVRLDFLHPWTAHFTNNPAETVVTGIEIDSTFDCTGVVCAPPGQCQKPGVCQPATGTCAYPNADDGIACDDDAIACTTGSTCQAGTCGAPTSTNACRLVLPGAVAFGSQRVGQASAPTQVFFTNQYPQLVSASGTSSNSEFTVTPAGPQSVTPDGAVAFSVVFTPTATGARSGNLVFASDTGSDTVALSGTGTQPAASIACPSPWSAPVGSSATATATITSTGTEALSVSGFSLSGANAGAFSVSPTMSVSLDPGANQAWTLAFSPSAAGAHSATLTFTTDAGPQECSLAGTGTAPAAALSKASLDFGSQRKGTTSSALQFTVSNGGSSALHLQAPALAGPNASDFTVSGGSTLVDAGGTSASFSVAFTPATAGAESGTISFTSDAGPLVVQLTGTGAFPTAVIEPTALAFGNQRRGVASAPSRVFVTNAGTSALTIGAPALASGADWAVTPSSAVTLAASTSQVYSVTFTPSALGARTDTLTLTSEAGSSSVALTGTGVEAVGTLSVTSRDFGQLRVGSRSPPLPVSLSNTGTDTLRTVSASLSGADAADFSLAGPSSCSILAGGSAAWSVSWTPGKTGAPSASLVLSADDGNHTVSLVGTGVNVAALADPAALAFGFQAVGSLSAAQTVLLKNTGTAPVALTGYSFTGDNPGDFKVSPPPSATQVASNASAGFSVSFTPTRTGARAAQLVFATDAGPIPVSLAGTAVVQTLSFQPVSVDFGSHNVGVNSAPIQVVVKNESSSPVNLGSLVLSGLNAGDFTVAQGPSPALVNPSATSTFALTFLSSAGGARSASASFSGDANGSTSVLALAGLGVVPTLAVSPFSVDFGPVRVGSASAPQTVTLANHGAEPLNLAQVTVEGSSFALSGLPTLPHALPAGQQLAFQLTYTPTAAAIDSPLLTITSDAPSITIPVTGRGAEVSLAVAPLSVQFGAVRLGSASALASILVSNTGPVATALSSLTVTGLHAADFTLLAAPAAGAPMAAGASLRFFLLFSPGAHGERAARLDLAMDGAQAHVDLSGTGLSPTVAASPLSLDFGTLSLDAAPLRKSVTVTNGGDTALRLALPSITGAAAAAFSAAPANADPIGPGASATVAVTFAPTAAGAAAAVLHLTSVDGDGASAEISLTGAAATPQLTIAPASLEFGDPILGETATMAVTLTNAGAIELLIASVSTTSLDYGVAVASLPILLRPQESVQTQVEFRPSMTGVSTAVLAVYLSGKTQPIAQAQLAGNGTTRKIASSGCGTGGWPAGPVLLLLAWAVILRVRSRERDARFQGRRRLGQSRVRRAFLAAIVALASSGVAQPADGASTDKDTAQAKTLYMQGEREFHLGHYEAALPLFELAYKTKPIPGLLYNVAQSHRLLGNFEQARRVYRAFLQQDPENPNAAVAREKLAEVEETMSSQANARQSPPMDLAAQEREGPVPLPSTRAPGAPPSAAAGGRSKQQTNAPAESISEAPQTPVVSDAPLYTKWWLWAAVGAVLVGGGAAAALSLGGSPPTSHFGNAQVF